MPPSPTIPSKSTPTPPTPLSATNSPSPVLSDIYPTTPPYQSNSPSSPHGLSSRTLTYRRTPSPPLSDIPRLQATHSTAGYRDGISFAKTAALQDGFDEGYSLGAELGQRAGAVVGLLEGIVAALGGKRDGGPGGKRNEESGMEDETGNGRKQDGEEGGKGREDARGLLERARMELRAEELFASRWWDGQGVWRFEVPGEGTGAEITFRDVVGAHPAIREWEAVATRLRARWGVHGDGLWAEERGEGDAGGDGGR